MSTDVEVVRFYTRARKFPQLIGRTPTGGRIWGGPYTITQAVGGGVVLFLGVNTMSIWGKFDLIGNAIVLLGTACVTVYALGRIPIGSRSPIVFAAGILQAATAPRLGRIGRRKVQPGKSSSMQTSCRVLSLPASKPVVREIAAGIGSSPAISTIGGLDVLLAPAAPAIPVSAPVALSGIQARLAARSR